MTDTLHYSKVSNNSNSNGGAALSRHPCSECEAAKLVTDFRAGGELRQNALKEMKEKVEESQILRKVLLEQLLIKDIIFCLTEKSLKDESKMCACFIIRKLTYLDRITANSQLYHCDGLPVLMREVNRASDDGIQEHCLISLLNSAAFFKNSQKLMTELGGVKTGLNILKSVNKGEKIKSCAAKFLANLILDNVHASKEVQESGALPVIVQLIHADDDAVAECAALALNNLLDNSLEARLEAIQSAGLFHRLVEIVIDDNYRCFTRCICSAVLLRMCETSAASVERCRDCFLAPDLIILQKQIKDDLWETQWCRSQLGKLIGFLKFPDES